ncbi:hypothetical protein ACWGDT_21240 [Streptomyces avermitilis]
MIQQDTTAVNDVWVLDWIDKVQRGDAPTWLGAVFAALGLLPPTSIGQADVMLVFGGPVHATEH